MIDFASKLSQFLTAFGVISSSENLHRDSEIESKSRKIMQSLHQSRVLSRIKKEKERKGSDQPSSGACCI
jgi:hypothetical protein